MHVLSSGQFNLSAPPPGNASGDCGKSDVTVARPHVVMQTRVGMEYDQLVEQLSARLA